MPSTTKDRELKIAKLKLNRILAEIRDYCEEELDALETVPVRTVSMRQLKFLEWILNRLKQ